MFYRVMMYRGAVHLLEVITSGGLFMKDIKGVIKERASFVAGLGSYFRDQADPVMLGAIDDTLEFVKTLPPEMPKPLISGGTTAAPEKIVTLSWYVVGKTNRIVSASVSFNGIGKCDVFWDGPDGAGGKHEGASVQDLPAMDIPDKVENLPKASP